MLVYRRTKKLSREPIVPCLDLRERCVTCKETSMLEFMTPANLRFQKALHVMKKIGFPEQKSKPVLEKLLELYDKNWEHIEQENYRVLADAILDSEEIEASEVKKQHENTKPGEDLERKIEVENELERPSNKLRLRSRESRSLPIIEPIEVCKVNKIPLDSDSECEEIESYSTSGRNSGKQHVSQNSSALRDRVYSLLPRKVSTKKRYFEGLSRQQVLKDPKVEQALNLRSKDKLACTSALLNSKDEPFVEKTRQPKVPIIVIDPEPLVGGNSASEKRINRQLPTVPSLPTEILDITSSISGNVKVSFTCNSDPALALPNFHMPNRNTIIKSLNNKFRRSYKISDPDFCVAKLVKDVSDCILELGTGSKTDTQSSSLQNTPSTPSNGSVNVQSNVDMADHTDSDDLDIQQWSHDPNDISRGQEKVAIPLVKGINNESPPYFHYIAHNAVLQNAYINFSLARIGDQNCCSSCSGNCLLSPNPCPCLYETGGEFAYTVEGLVKEDFLDECVSMNRYPEKHCHFYCQECPLERSKNEAVLESCKGHLMRRFIKECWVKCGCNIQCGNRVVQRGISRQLEVFMTRSGKGWGLRTLEELPKGAFVCEYVGEVLTNAELHDRISKSEKKEKHTYPVLLDADWGAEGVLKDEEALCLDATFYGNVARFINHRCYDSNLVEIPVEIETPDHHYYHLAFFTTRKVAALEELTWDYGIDFDDHKHPVKAFSCQCGSRHCRKRKKAKPRTKIRGIGI